VIEILLQAERALEMGRVDAAETLYQQVADADPRNSIAVVGLARVTLERGDEAGALQLARRALAIDPENAAAHRMVERLEEVIRYRGQEPPAPEAATEVAAVPATEPEPEPTIEPEPSIVPAAAPSPPPPKRRSFLDRLLRRNR
jgi:thioredoxin-like negative regulator of GroEL